MAFFLFYVNLCSYAEAIGSTSTLADLAAINIYPFSTYHVLTASATLSHSKILNDYWGFLIYKIDRVNDVGTGKVYNCYRCIIFNHMDEINYEAQHREEYYQKVAQGLDILLESIKTVQLEFPDYEMISGKVTSEVDAYVRQNLIRSLSDAKTRILQELQTHTDPAAQGSEPKRVVKENMQRAILFLSPCRKSFLP